MPVVFKSVIDLCHTEHEWGQCWLYALEAMHALIASAKLNSKKLYTLLGSPCSPC